MTRVEIKTRAKQQLGNNIFGNLWMMALLICLCATVLEGIAGTIIPGIGVIVIVGPLSYGIFYVFLMQSRYGGAMNFTDIFKGFTDFFGDTFLIGLMTAVYTFLWSLLFVIPGIVKAYSYSMAYFIKADHPEYDWNTCITESRKLMDGHKAELFVQDLSFIGWYIVGSIVLGVGVLWVMPYHIASYSQFYLSITQPKVTGGETVNP